MSFSKRRRQQMLAHCDEVQPDDGVDPRDFFRSRSRSSGDSRNHRKAWQLCRQARDALSLSLSADGRDSLLNSMRVEQVLPAPDASRLLVLVATDDDRQLEIRREILEKLRQHSGRLRAELASSITRKRVPQLVFEVASPEQGGAR